MDIPRIGLISNRATPCSFTSRRTRIRYFYNVMWEWIQFVLDFVTVHHYVVLGFLITKQFLNWTLSDSIRPSWSDMKVFGDALNISKKNINKTKSIFPPDATNGKSSIKQFDHQRPPGLKVGKLMLSYCRLKSPQVQGGFPSKTIILLSRIPFWLVKLFENPKVCLNWGEYCCFTDIKIQPGSHKIVWYVITRITIFPPKIYKIFLNNRKNLAAIFACLYCMY